MIPTSVEKTSLNAVTQCLSTGPSLVISSYNMYRLSVLANSPCSTEMSVNSTSESLEFCSFCSTVKFSSGCNWSLGEEHLLKGSPHCSSNLSLSASELSFSAVAYICVIIVTKNL